LIFEKASSIGPSRAILETLLLNASSLVFTTVSLVLIDIVGRRPMLLVGSIGMTAAHVLLGACLYWNFPGLYTVFSVFAFNIFFQISIGPVAWLVLSEIFPTRLRAKGQSAGTLAIWTSTYISNQFTAPLMSYFDSSFGSAGPAFWLYAVVCFMLFIFGLKMVPETKQRNLEEIARWWQPVGARGEPTTNTLADMKA